LPPLEPSNKLLHIFDMMECNNPKKDEVDNTKLEIPIVHYMAHLAEDQITTNDTTTHVGALT